MSDKQKNSIIESVEENIRFFEFNLTIKVFGKIIYQLTFPPKN